METGGEDLEKRIDGGVGSGRLGGVWSGHRLTGWSVGATIWGSADGDARAATGVRGPWSLVREAREHGHVHELSASLPVSFWTPPPPAECEWCVLILIF